MASTSSSSGTAAGGGALSDEGAKVMAECIDLLFGQWTALQLSVRNRWGGRDSQAKAGQLAASVLSWFTHGAKGSGRLDQDELEDLLYDAMVESFNADLEDGSVEEITKYLMIMYTRCLGQHYSYLDKLRKNQLAGNAIMRSKTIIMPTYGAGNESSDDDEVGPVEVEALRNPRPPKPVPDGDGWTAVAPRRRRR